MLAGLMMGLVIIAPAIGIFGILICCTSGSIIMPTYKRPAALKRAIESVLKQTYTNFKLYVVGDVCPFLN